MVLTALVTALAVGIGAIGLMFYKRGQQQQGRETVQANNSKNVNAVIPVNAGNSNRAPNVNANSSANNAAANLSTPTATPTAKPTIDPKEIDRMKSGVKDTIENWRDSTESLDLDSILSNYADTVDYYNAGRVDLGKVRADKQRAFEVYDSVDIGIDNLKITPDETGEKATALFDKRWNFEGADKVSSGKVQQQLQFARIGGRWLITGEKDLKVYSK